MKIRAYLGVAAAAAITVCAGQVRVMAGGNQGTTCGNVGPDVIVGGIYDTFMWGTTDGVTGYSIGTESCNIGDENLSWVAIGNQHPVIAQNLYRYADGRFEQIGLGWLKHGFTALTLNLCGCGCSGQGGSVLGVGCSDPYGASLNGSQGGFSCGGGQICGGLGPRSEVNPATGEYLYPYGRAGEFGGNLFKRMQVPIADLDPEQNPGARYYAEGQYVSPDDAAAGNHQNNVSYRRVTPTRFNFGGWQLGLMGQTHREQPAIYAWRDNNDPKVVIEVIDDQSDGRLNLGYRVTDNGDGTWHYEFALHNQTSHRAAREFSVPIGAGVTLTNIGFRDKHHHSGDGAVIGVDYDTTDWAVNTGLDSVTWSTDTEADNVNANALRWGVIYNFRFDADRPPGPVSATIGLYRAGTPDQLVVEVLGPSPCPWDLNGDQVVASGDLLMLLGMWHANVVGPPDFDGDGIVATADLLELLGLWGPCPGVELGRCGAPGTGSCYLPNAVPGCLNGDCCELVCAAEPGCCDLAWDKTCVDMAFDICGNCGQKGAGDCCLPNGTPGCDDLVCCQSICVADSFCCDSAWDLLCADQAVDQCTCP